MDNNNNNNNNNSNNDNNNNNNNNNNKSNKYPVIVPGALEMLLDSSTGPWYSDIN